MKKKLDITSEFMLDYYDKKVIKNPSPAEKRVLIVPGKLQPTSGLSRKCSKTQVIISL